MPNINLRLTDSEHAQLHEWAHGSRRSLQREIVFRLFDARTTGTDAREMAARLEPVPEPVNRRPDKGGSAERGSDVVGRVIRADGPDAGSTPAAAVSPRSVQATVHDVPMRPHFRGDRPALQCDQLVPGGATCDVCGKVVV